MAHDISDLQEGSHFGNYEIRGTLGQGGMGTVYKAYDTVKRRIVALKVLAPHLTKDPTFRERFRRESHAAAQLQEPHVIPIHDWGDVDGTLYIDMRLVQGVDLHTLLKKGPLPPERAVAINSQIAAALDAAHAEGLIHRDVKPDNILVTPNDFAYLVDFGIASAKGDTRLTNVGSAIGSFAYMAPERMSDEPVTAAADIYALGCVLYECLTGTEPYASGRIEVLMASHATAAPPRPSAVNPAVPSTFDDVIARAMAKDPDDRYGSAGAFGRAAQRALRAAPAHATVSDATFQATSPAMPTVPHTAGPRYASAPPGDPALMHHQQGPGQARPSWLMPSLIAAAVAIIVVAVGIAFLVVRDQRPDTADDTTTNTPTTDVGTEPRTTNATGPTGSPTPRQDVTPPLVQGPDTYDESCDQGIAHPTATGWASRAGRGTPETSCYFADSVLKAYWAQYPAPSRDPRTVLAAGRVPCPTTGSTCSGTDYVMECQALGSEDWITCTGGSNARIYLY